MTPSQSPTPPDRLRECGQDRPVKAMTLTSNDRAVLRAMAEQGEDFGFMSFRAIAAASGVELKAIRRVVRRLARGGHTKFSSGLWTDDGTPAGAGYAITDFGRLAIGCAAEPDMAALRAAFHTASTEALPGSTEVSNPLPPVGAGRG